MCCARGRDLAPADRGPLRDLAERAGDFSNLCFHLWHFLRGPVAGPNTFDFHRTVLLILNIFLKTMFFSNIVEIMKIWAPFWVTLGGLLGASAPRCLGASVPWRLGALAPVCLDCLFLLAFWIVFFSCDLELQGRIISGHWK
jgi:hypothetical protein